MHLIERRYFRCGKFVCTQKKSTGKPVGPHSSEKSIKKYLRSGRYYGCGQVFQLVQVEEGADRYRLADFG